MAGKRQERHHGLRGSGQAGYEIYRRVVDRIGSENSGKNNSYCV